MKPAKDKRLQSIIVVVMKAGIDPWGWLATDYECNCNCNYNCN